MKALLLAAGFGTRLGKLTESTPKCLITVNNQTMLDHWIYKLYDLGVDEFIINTHYLADQVEAFALKHPLKEKIKLSFESKLLGTSNTLYKHSKELSKSDAFIVHVDNYCEDDLKSFLKIHKNYKTEYPLTMLTFNTAQPNSCGIVHTDKNDILTKFEEKPVVAKSNQANGAVYLASDIFFQKLSNFEMNTGEITVDIIPKLVGHIKTVKTQHFFEDMGTIENYKKVIKFVSCSRKRY